MGYDEEEDEFNAVFEGKGMVKLDRAALQAAIVRYHEKDMKKRGKTGGFSPVGLSIMNPDSMVDAGDFDEGNILVGKRKRGFVDYNKLNGEMFGNLTPTKVSASERRAARNERRGMRGEECEARNARRGTNGEVQYDRLRTRCEGSERAGAARNALFALKLSVCERFTLDDRLVPRHLRSCRTSI